MKIIMGTFGSRGGLRLMKPMVNNSKDKKIVSNCPNETNTDSLPNIEIKKAGDVKDNHVDASDK